MRGVIVLVTGVFTIAAVVMVAGVVVEPIAQVVVSNQAVQNLGWTGHVTSIQTTVLRWGSLLGIVFFVVWAFLWALRRSRTTEVRR